MPLLHISCYKGNRHTEHRTWIVLEEQSCPLCSADRPLAYSHFIDKYLIMNIGQVFFIQS